jgi:hypothetical protein
MEYVEDFFSRERRRCRQMFCRSRMALLEQAPRNPGQLTLPPFPPFSSDRIPELYLLCRPPEGSPLWASRDCRHSCDTIMENFVQEEELQDVHSFASAE